MADINPVEHLTFFLTSFRGGGIEKVTIHLVKELLRRDKKVSLVTVDGRGPFRNEIDPNCKLIDLNQKRARYALFPLLKSLLILKPDTAISSQTHLNALIILLRFLTGFPKTLIVCEHITITPDLIKSEPKRERMRHFIISNLYKFADAVVAVSEDAAASMREYTSYQGKIDVVHNGMDLDEIFERSQEPLNLPELPQKPAGKLIIGMGRLSPQKNFSLLIESFSLLPEKFNAHLVILGEGPMRTALEAQIKNLGLEDRATLPGFVQNPYPIMANADLFALSSNWEGFATVILEALTLGLPIAATNCPGGPAGILKKSNFSLLVRPKNPQALAQAMQSLLKEKIDRQSIRDFAQTFHISQMADNYLALIDDIKQRNRY